MSDGNFESKIFLFFNAIKLFSSRVAKALASSLLAMPMKMIQMPPLMPLKPSKTWMTLRVSKEMKVMRKLNISPSKILIWKKNILLLPVSFEWHKRFLSTLLLKGTASSSDHHKIFFSARQCIKNAWPFVTLSMKKSESFRALLLCIWPWECSRLVIMMLD